MPSASRTRPRSLADRLLADAGEGEITADEQAAAAEASFRPVPRALLVPIERITPSRDNPRTTFAGLDDLAASIAERGVLQPLLVRRDLARPGYYITVAGARRLLAARIVQGSDEAASRERAAMLPCVVMDQTDRDAFADALAENLAREDLSRAEVMTALLRLQTEYGWSARYIARRTGRSVGDVAELLGIARDEAVAPLVRDELITPTAAGQIRRLPEGLRPRAIAGVRAGRVKTVEDVRRIRRREEEQARASAPTPAPPAVVATPTDAPRQPAVVSDIGHPREADTPGGAPRVGGGEGVDGALRSRPDAARAEVAAAAEGVVRAVRALAGMAGPVDAAALARLREARDELVAFLARHDGGATAPTP